MSDENKPTSRSIRPGQAYASMVGAILESLDAGHLAIGDRLPSEAQLAKQNSISVTSVRRGIDLLVEKGIIERRHGSGMYVMQVPATPLRPTRRDTIAILYHFHHRGYHPFYTEMRKGVAAGLVQHGWRLWQQEPAYSTDETIWTAIEPEKLRAFFREHREFAGAILSPFFADVVKDWPADERLPLVVPSYTPNSPFITYDWPTEMAAALRIVLKQNARKILAITRMKEDDFKSAIALAAMAEKRKAPQWQLRAVNPGDAGFSGWVNSAFSITKECLEQDPEIDSVVAGSDFELQGVLDALAQLGKRVPQDIKLAALVNKHSQLRSAYTFPAVVADGYQTGIAAAEMLHERILSPDQAPYHIRLRGYVREYLPS